MHNTYTVSHSIQLNITGGLSELEQALAALPGVSRVIFDQSRLTVEYDARKLQWAHIEGALDSCGNSLAPGLINSLKSSWFSFIDRNIEENARHKPHCCNRPPK